MHHLRRLHTLCPNPNPRFFSSLASSPAINGNDPSTLCKYLIDTFSFPPKRALAISTRFQTVKQNPKTAFEFLRKFGFSGTQIRSSVTISPQIIFSDIDNVLKPKLEYLREQLGLSGNDLGDAVSKNPKLLLSSLDNILIPFVGIIKKIIRTNNNEELVKAMQRSRWMGGRDGLTKLISNIAFLEDRCKIVRSRLSALLTRHSSILFLPEAYIRGKVERALELGLTVDSGMFLHAFIALCGMTDETFGKKLGLLKSFGFSEDECIRMFRRAPSVFLASEETLKVRVDFFQNQINDINKFGSSLLVVQPCLLKFSFEKRIIPRCRVLRLIKSKRLLKCVPCITTVLSRPEEVFLRRYVMRFTEDEEELLRAYRGDGLVSSNK